VRELDGIHHALLRLRDQILRTFFPAENHFGMVLMEGFLRNLTENCFEL
jgi:hypothetical protein